MIKRLLSWILYTLTLIALFITHCWVLKSHNSRKSQYHVVRKIRVELFLKLCKLQKKNSLFFQIMAKWLEQWDRSQGLEFVPLTISYHLYFLWISKVLSMLHHGSVECYFIFKECYFIFTYAFLALFWSFWSKKFCFYHFHFFFLMKYRISAT